MKVRNAIYAAISAERDRQERLLIERNWRWSMASPGVPHFEKLMPLMEELGEVAHAIRREEGFTVAGNSHDNHGLWAELVQLAACAVAFLEALQAEELEENRA